MKILLIVFSFIVCNASAQNITDSLLLYYPMDGNSNDLSGNNFNGTPSGVTSVTNRYGVPNSAYYFDGVNDYIDFPLNDTLKPDFPLTIAFWTKLKVLGIQDSEFLNTDFVQNNYHGVWLNVSSLGYLSIGFGGGQGGCNSYNRVSFKATELPVDTGVWYHFTGVIYSTTNMKLYINCNNAGANFSTGSGPINIAYSNNISGTIGRMDYQTNGPAAQFWGYLDEFSYWERALNSAEVHTLCDSLPLMSSAPSWDCIANSCVDPGNGSGMYTALSSCQSSCGSTTINEFNAERKLLRIVDVLGRNAKKESNVPLFYFYNDGTVEKKFIIN
jgi:hypothetical protein